LSLTIGMDLLRRVNAAMEGQQREIQDGTLNLIASQNLLSPAARAALSGAFADKLGSGARGRASQVSLPGRQHVEGLESALLEAAQRLFGTPHIDYRLLSGSIANQMAMMALIPRGAKVMTMPRYASADPSVREEGYLRWLGVKLLELPWDYDSINVDLDEYRRALREQQPDWLIVGGSRPLFPYPVAEMARAASAIGCRILYDGAHLLGLWAGGQFQDPIAEGADIVTGSTQKTLPGPVGGLLLGRDGELVNEVSQLLTDALGSYNNARVACLAVSLCEMVAFGRDYAAALVANARALGQALVNEGFQVMGSHLGFTSSHQTLLLLPGVRVADVMAALQAASILSSPVNVIRQNGAKPEPALRLGPNDPTRRGMGPGEMAVTARLLRRLLLDGEAPERVASAVRELRAAFPGVHYTFAEH
jgi:glycine hydroxymethyltransferase